MDTSVRVVVPCYNDSAVIDRCLRAIFATRDLELDVVVVDDGANGDLRRLRVEWPLTLAVTSGHNGASSARNFGTQGYAGDVVVFVDADVEVAPDAIARLVRPIRSEKADATVGSYSRCVDQHRFAEAYKQLYLAHTYGRRDGELTNTFWSALGAVRAESFREAGGFDGRIRGAGPEDVLLGMELTRRGRRILAVPGATAKHLARIGLVGLFWNDLRKGSEDVYAHWTRLIPLTDNRHAHPKDIIAVLFACLGFLFLVLPFPSRLYWLLLSGSIALHSTLRASLLFKAYLPAGLSIWVPSIPVTYVLDVVRGVAVVAGTSLAALEAISRGRIKPFRRANDAAEGLRV